MGPAYFPDLLHGIPHSIGLFWADLHHWSLNHNCPSLNGQSLRACCPLDECHILLTVKCPKDTHPGPSKDSIESHLQSIIAITILIRANWATGDSKVCWGSKMAERVKVLAPSLITWIWSLGSKWRNERTDFSELSLASRHAQWHRCTTRTARHAFKPALRGRDREVLQVKSQPGLHSVLGQSKLHNEDPVSKRKTYNN